MVTGGIRDVAVPEGCLEPLETRLLRSGYESEGAGCCPVGLQETGHIPATPEEPQPVADVVEPDGMGELRINQADQMAPRTEGARFLVHAGLPCQLRHQIVGNQIANLPQHGKLASAWKGCCFFHPCRVAGQTGFSKLFSLRAMRWL